MGAASIFCFLFLLASATVNALPVFDVTKHGGKPGTADLSPALLKAFTEACATVGGAKVLVPAGDYTMGMATMSGPCKGPMEFEIKGKINAFPDPAKFKGDSWVKFDNMVKFQLYGGGEFNGHGKAAWAINDCTKSIKCGILPTSVRFNFITEGVVRDITSRDSKFFHINLLSCKNITVTNVKIFAPLESPNTDGIHIGRNNGVNITNSEISTGDDCISIGDGNSNVFIKGIKCGPGHGISVGSLGRYHNEAPVVNVRVINCTLKETDNGVRIKTWPTSPSNGIASDIHFEDITMINVKNPVLVDQEYCPWGFCKKDKPSTVKLSKISFKKIRGTSGNKEAVKILCSKTHPCEGVEIGDIDLTYSGPEGPPTFVCHNVNPKLIGTQKPKACSTPFAAAPAAAA